MRSIHPVITAKIAVIIIWIYEHPDWPRVTWNTEALSLELADLAYCQGRLLGRMERLGFRHRQEARLDTFTQDVVTTSAIEGENLNPEEVRLSVARHLGIDQPGLVLPTSRAIEGVVEMTLDAIQSAHQPLTLERLFGWHAALFPTGYSGIHRITVAAWRTNASGPMHIVFGPLGRERVHFEAPSAEKLDTEMSLFLQWFNQSDTLNPILEAAIAHRWFVTIHPFEDGNGRIARAISDMALARSPDITDWLRWVMGCMQRAIHQAETVLEHVLFKASLWESISHCSINERQRLIINCLLDPNFEGHLNTSKYAKLAKCSKDTALRDIQELKHRGILLQNKEGGRSTSYRLTNDPSSIVCP